MNKQTNPIIEVYDGINVIRDDLFAGGTKARFIGDFLTGADEFVYASPAYGYAQIALAYACKAKGNRATIFTAERKELHKRTQEAQNAGADIVLIPHGYLSNVKSKARQYCKETGAKLIPFGFDFPAFSEKIKGFAKSLSIHPKEVWVVSGSGTLCRALQAAWSNADFHTVLVGGKANVGRAKVYNAPEKFEQDARIKPPYPSCSNYDAKVWRFIKAHASKGAYFWNVAG